MPYIVVDASVAGAWLFAEALSPKALTILLAIQKRKVIALVPDRFEEELLRVCQKKLLPPPQGAGLTEAEAFDLFLELMTSPLMLLHRLPSQELHERAWDMAVSLPGLTTHDALYLALAERWEAELWTADHVLGGPAAILYPKVYDLFVQPFPY